ncbi:hypothetical protein [Dactylosporangium sp. NPDC051541]|uniref:hypothetical protein n=1 Tax=Dactylosporangium sp. NPDC051541 TaxID=3363977 RepID=UPI0037A5B001
MPNLQRYRPVAAALIALTVLAGCSGQDDPVTTSAAASTSPSPSPTPADLPSTPADIISMDSLVKFAAAMPAPKGAPAGGKWTEALPPSEGREFVNYMVGSQGYVSVQFADCRLPAVQAKKSDYKWCFLTPKSKVKGFNVATLDDDPDYPARVVTAGHATLLVNVWVGFDDKFKGADVEAFIAALDLAKLSKL